MPITINIEDSEVFKEVLIKGKREGLIEGMLEIKYGHEGLALMDMVRKIDKASKLDEFKELIKKPTSVLDLRLYLEKNIWSCYGETLFYKMF